MLPDSVLASAATPARRKGKSEQSELLLQKTEDSLHAINIVSQPHILIEAVLVIVRVHERNDDKRRLQCLNGGPSRHGAAHHADAHRFGRECRLEGTVNPLT